MKRCAPLLTMAGRATNGVSLPLSKVIYLMVHPAPTFVTKELRERREGHDSGRGQEGREGSLPGAAVSSDPPSLSDRFSDMALTFWGRTLTWCDQRPHTASPGVQ